MNIKHDHSYTVHIFYSILFLLLLPSCRIMTGSHKNNWDRYSLHNNPFLENGAWKVLSYYSIEKKKTIELKSLDYSIYYDTSSLSIFLYKNGIIQAKGNSIVGKDTLGDKRLFIVPFIEIVSHYEHEGTMEVLNKEYWTFNMEKTKNHELDSNSKAISSILHYASRVTISNDRSQVTIFGDWPLEDMIVLEKEQ